MKHRGVRRGLVLGVKQPPLERRKKGKREKRGKGEERKSKIRRRKGGKIGIPIRDREQVNVETFQQENVGEKESH